MNLREKYMQEALQVLNQRRQKNMAIQQERHQIIRQNLPEVLDLRANIAEKTKEFYLKTLETPEKKEEFLTAFAKLRQETDHSVQTLLTANGYPTDYLNPVYDCSICKDTGFLENLEMCSCLNKEFIARAYQSSNLLSVLEKENFDNFDFNYYRTTADATTPISPRENMQIVFGECYKFAHEFGSHDQNLFLFGPSGLGKTFLCSAIAKVVLDNGFSVIYLPAPEFFDLFQRYRFRLKEEAVDFNYMESLFACDLLILDDLGTEVINSYTQQDLFQTLNRRINDKKCTVISSNLSLAELSKSYSERIASRILGEYLPLKFWGEDIRKQKYQ